MTPGNLYPIVFLVELQMTFWILKARKMNTYVFLPKIDQVNRSLQRFSEGILNALIPWKSFSPKAERFAAPESCSWFELKKHLPEKSEDEHWHHVGYEILTFSSLEGQAYPTGCLLLPGALPALLQRLLSIWFFSSSKLVLQVINLISQCFTFSAIPNYNNIMSINPYLWIFSFSFSLPAASIRAFQHLINCNCADWLNCATHLLIFIEPLLTTSNFAHLCMFVSLMRNQNKIILPVSCFIEDHR